MIWFGTDQDAFVKWLTDLRYEYLRRTGLAADPDAVRAVNGFAEWLHTVQLTEWQQQNDEYTEKHCEPDLGRYLAGDMPRPQERDDEV